MQALVKILSIQKITHDVLQIRTEKPSDYDFIPGQATEVSINREGWKDEKRPFTFTSLPGEKELEFTIKTYPAHEGMTNQLLQCKEGDELLLHEVFGAIAYKGEGTFIAGGAGVTPFISIFRDLRAKEKLGNNKLIFANNTEADIILKEEFEDLLDDKFVNILAREETTKYPSGHITSDFLKHNLSDPRNHIYLCGPPPMMEAVELQLKELGLGDSQIIKEEF